VVDAASGDAVRKAVVTITWQGTPRAWATTRTDGSGRFRFEGLPVGKFDLRAAKAGIGTAVYGGKGVQELGEFVTLADGETREEVTLRFIHSGSIAGRVLDPGGDPIVGANVMMMRYVRNLGERILVNFRSASTNDRGEYRMTGVDAGQYYLVTDPFRGGIGPFRANRPETYARQFYGGARESKDANPVILKGGESLTGFDFHLTVEPLVKVRGQITGVPELPAPPQPDARVQRMKVDGAISVTVIQLEEGQQRGRWGIGSQGPDYKFEFGEMQAGRYRLEASVQGKDRMYAASQEVEVREGIGDVMLNLAPAMDLKGQLRIEGQGGPPLNSFNVVLARRGLGGQGSSARVGTDGSFTLAHVPPGELGLNVTQMPRGAFLKSASWGDKDVRFSWLEVGSKTDAALNIVISMNSARVEGDVDAAGADSTRAGILLAPIGAMHNLARFYYGVAADGNGKFKLEGIAPGKYKIFALEKMAAANFRTPEAAEQLDALGTEIELTEGATTQARPKLIPMERSREALQ
jgi:hypothetical protein